MSSDLQRIQHVGTYNDGTPFLPARGRYAPRDSVGDHLTTVHPVIQGRPTSTLFVRTIVRELKIRFYQPKTIKSYGNLLTSFLRWFGAPPHRVTREDVRNYLELLVDGGASSSWVGVHLAAIRTAFDKMCGRRITLGLETPRRPKRLPVVPSAEEVRQLLEAAPSLRDKMLIGLMYALGVRVSEVVRLRYSDVNFDRRVITVWQGKGRSDRQVMLPHSFEPLLRHMAGAFAPDEYLFPGERTGRHLSPRTVERVVGRAVIVADLNRKITPHSLRHAFATHLLENGTDIRFIQKYLGHVRLETTTIYTRVAVLRENRVESPLDVLTGNRTSASRGETTPRPVGTMKLTVVPRQGAPDGPPTADACILVNNQPQSVELSGIVLSESRPGWVSLELPPTEVWEERLQRLSPNQQERIASPEFYQYLQRHLGERFLALKPDG